MSSPGCIDTLGPLCAFPHCSTSSHSSPCFIFTFLYHLLIMSTFFDGSMGPPSSNEEMQVNWGQYTAWQCYMLTRDIEAAETTRHLDQQHKLLDKALSTLFELQLEFQAYKCRSACQSCGRRGVQSPSPVGRSHWSRVLLRWPRRNRLPSFLASPEHRRFKRVPLTFPIPRSFPEWDEFGVFSIDLSLMLMVCGSFILGLCPSCQAWEMRFPGRRPSCGINFLHPGGGPLCLWGPPLLLLSQLQSIHPTAPSIIQGAFLLSHSCHPHKSALEMTS